ncbi:PTS glucose transporter subunit IIA [Enterococcus devriesei]|uniref:PTS system, glucose subfamily, IIA component n=1 Tax=Enterococcus devriesei TaxID=319970 RepID=A0A1L8SXD2_9ENTE|nr:PTS glucose transporter subunit IIA [Enterococcus devriesei]OJG36707.1 PTS system, glucose subfamily, IIA component [Enterococcus devriesei]
MFGLFNKKVELHAPVSGNVIEITEVNDPVFSQKMMGDGFAVKPTAGQINSPINGRVKSIFPTLHAVALETDDGQEMLLHIGIDTVELNGEGFQSNLIEGQKIKIGDPLVQVDLAVLAEKGKDNVIIIVLPELKDKQVIVQTGEKQSGEVAAILK